MKQRVSSLANFSHEFINDVQGPCQCPILFSKNSIHCLETDALPQDRKTNRISPNSRKADSISPQNRKTERISPNDRKSDKILSQDRKTEYRHSIESSVGHHRIERQIGYHHRIERRLSRQTDACSDIRVSAGKCEALHCFVNNIIY